MERIRFSKQYVKLHKGSCRKGRCNGPQGKRRNNRSGGSGDCRLVISPFENDMFSLVYQAFRNLYPDKECRCQWLPEIKQEDGSPAFGVTTFSDDGDVLVEVSAGISVGDSVEVFAHELAHVAVGEAGGHGVEWENAFNAIFREYARLGEELLNG